MKVLCIAVHPDDETLGCGGTLLRHKDLGDEIHWLIMTEATTQMGYSADFLEKRSSQIKQVNAAYGFKSVTKAGFETTRLDQYPLGEIISKISDTIEGIKPEIIYLPYSGDIHSDHQVTYKAAFSCTKPFRYPFIRKVYAMETLSETDLSDKTFSPNTYKDITKFIDQKLEIMSLYDSEVAKPPFPRSLENIRALATVRGSTANVLFAESFILIREIS